MRPKHALLILLFIIPLLSISGPVKNAHASYRMVTNASDSWPSAGTSTAQVNSVTVADPDSDSTQEIITAGTMYNATSTTNRAELRVYHKTGSSLVLEGSLLWNRVAAWASYYSGAEVADVDGDGQLETVIVGNTQYTPYQSHIGVYRFTGASFLREKLYNFSGPAFSIETKGLAIWSHAGVYHIVTAGHFSTSTGVDTAQLGIWQWDGSIFSRKTLYNWTTPGGWAQAQAVATGDVDGDGMPDIVTVAYSYNGTQTNTQLRVWGWDGSSLNAKQTREWSSQQWQATVTVKDVTGDATPEILVGDEIMDFPFVKGRLTVYSDSTGSLVQQAQTKWLTSDTQSVGEVVTRLTAADVDGDGKAEIVASGLGNIPRGSIDLYYASLTTWNLEGSTLTLKKNYHNPTPYTFAMTVATADVDGDGKQDIVTAGYWVDATSGSAYNRGLVEIRDVGYVYASLGLNVNPTAVAGQSVTVSGSLINQTNGAAFASAPVLVEYSKAGEAYRLLATLTTDSQGRFATSFTPNGPGPYTVRASWAGDEEDMPATATANFNVNKSSSVIVLYASNFNVKPGESLTVKGYLFPATPATITLSYTSPSGTVTTRTVTSDSTGAFNDQITPDSDGTWKVSASWAGTSDSESATSDAIRVQAQPEPLGLQLSTFGFAIAIASLALAATAIMKVRGRSSGSSSGRSVELIVEKEPLSKSPNPSSVSSSPTSTPPGKTGDSSK